MDPRRPELSIARLDELMEQYKKILNDMKTCNVSSRLAQFEREGGLVVQEICLVAPRLHEAMIQVSRTRRSILSMGVAYVPEEKVGNYIKATIGMEERPVLTDFEKNVKTGEETYVEPNQAETVIVEPKPRKKKTTKKKKAE